MKGEVSFFLTVRYETSVHCRVAWCFIRWIEDKGCIVFALECDFYFFGTTLPCAHVGNYTLHCIWIVVLVKLNFLWSS